MLTQISEMYEKGQRDIKVLFTTSIDCDCFLMLEKLVDTLENDLLILTTVSKYSPIKNKAGDNISRLIGKYFSFQFCDI